MSEDQQIESNASKTDIARVATSTFFSIIEKWHVKNGSQKILLGMPSDSTFYAWKKDGASSISYDTLERISYIMGIYKVLSILFSNKEQANLWVSKKLTRYIWTLP